jgi:hypothetical protein
MTASEPFQFSLRLLFAGMLVAAGFFALLVHWGPFAFAPVLGIHVGIMIAICRLPGPWTLVRDRLVCFGWLMVAAYVPLGCSFALEFALWMNILARSAPLQASIQQLYGWPLLLLPLLLYAFVQCQRYADLVFAEDRRFERPFRWSCVAMLAGFMGFFLGNLLWPLSR